MENVLKSETILSQISGHDMFVNTQNKYCLKINIACAIKLRAWFLLKIIDNLHDLYPYFKDENFSISISSMTFWNLKIKYGFIINLMADVFICKLLYYLAQ